MSFQAGGRGCFNCGDASHQARDCPKKGTPTCYNCGGRECTVAPKEKSCYRCGGVGHISRECQASPAEGFGGAAAGWWLWRPSADLLLLRWLRTHGSRLH
ncbi:hypothetical protein BO85DRAFT_74283 [Aspergillus piperis CBS 112811]|uniref:CCHC-type domain-containing protein n=1 Tax=Aspergillus piperis CBS 112811 TaxID=1448313 RepID=A0A8G1QZP5_9EURO|nr:hypothetical protein BO85DRAFT_74283 [Aspergillus piperis CBS 112811]RAH55559.1 hypothetical protein BO85DRAFT_74283 [Aspergillus piperis CBS 112811]